MDDKEWDELKLIQEKLHEALDKGYPLTLVKVLTPKIDLSNFNVSNQNE